MSSRVRDWPRRGSSRPLLTHATVLHWRWKVALSPQMVVDSSGAGGGAGVATAAPVPLAPFRSNDVKASGERKSLPQASSGGDASRGSGVSGLGGGYGPMAALARGSGLREHESSLPAAPLDGAGEPGAGLSDLGGSWLPAAQQSEAAFTVSNVSWGQVRRFSMNSLRPNRTSLPTPTNPNARSSRCPVDGRAREGRCARSAACTGVPQRRSPC